MDLDPRIRECYAALVRALGPLGSEFEAYAADHHPLASYKWLYDRLPTEPADSEIGKLMGDLFWLAR